MPDRPAIVFGLACLVSVNAVSLTMMLKGASSEWYVWFAPSVLLAVWAIKRPTPQPLPRREGEQELSASCSPSLEGGGWGVGEAASQRATSA